MVHRCGRGSSPLASTLIRYEHPESPHRFRGNPELFSFVHGPPSLHCRINAVGRERRTKQWWMEFYSHGFVILSDTGNEVDWVDIHTAV
jgi:hypothetical protein